MKLKHEIAGLVLRKRNKLTGHLVSIYFAFEADMDDSLGPWATVCEAHGTVCSHRTIRLARRHMTNPLEWCEECRKAAGG